MSGLTKAVAWSDIQDIHIEVTGLDHAPGGVGVFVEVSSTNGNCWAF